MVGGGCYWGVMNREAFLLVGFMLLLALWRLFLFGLNFADAFADCEDLKAQAALLDLTALATLSTRLKLKVAEVSFQVMSKNTEVFLLSCQKNIGFCHVTPRIQDSSQEPGKW